MRDLSNPVEGRISHYHIWGGHVDFGAKYVGTVLEFSGAHPLEQVQIFFN
jgi:hypothetical protein